MFRVAACVFEHHNLWLVLLAAAICASACAGVFFVLGGLAQSTDTSRRNWLMLAALLAGGGTWATHFVAMLGYNPGLPIGYDLGLTLLSAAACVAGAWGAFKLNDGLPGARGQIAGGALLGLAIIAMHYIGMVSVQAAARQVWALDLVVASWFFSTAFSIAALWAFAHAPARWRLVAAAGLLVIAIVSLHFTAMGALTLELDPRVMGPSHALDTQTLAITIAVVAAAGLLAAVFVAVADRRVTATELAAAKQAAAMALHDALTGLSNRRHLQIALGEMLSRRHQRLAIIVVDLDRFKPVNDLYGHAVGDELLVVIAKLLTEEAGETGIAARIGGDEFVLVLACDDDEALLSRLSAMVATFDAPIRLSGHEVSVGATLGVALAPTDGDEAQLLLRRADAALYRAKEEGRGRFAFFEAGMDARALERATLEQELRAAVRNDEIIPYFQPLVQLESGEVVGYEILARWPHAKRGLVGPGQFIQVAEETGLIGELTFNLLRRACTEALDWPERPRLSLNIAPSQLRDAALPQKLLKVLTACGFPPARLEIEITEDALVCDFDGARLLLLSLKNLGMRIALDDFGTGYSSLKHLRELPFDVLKIDRSFVTDMGDSSEAMSIVKTIVQLAKSLGLGVTAEGIETSQQAQELTAIGCERGQGFLLGRPGSGPLPQGVEVETCAAKLA
ncbi:MAG: EAL domain-containing protein [Vitreimonas sp.]